MGNALSTASGENQISKVGDHVHNGATEKPSAAHELVYGKDGFKNLNDLKNADLLNEHGKESTLKDFDSIFKKSDASKEDIDKAAKKLDDSISPVAPKDMQQDMKDIHAGVLSGDHAKVAAAIKDIQEKHPEMLKDAIKEMNRQFKENNAGVEMALTADGKVLLYKNDPFDMSGNKTALQIDPKDGSVGARPIKVRDDGSVVVEPGEIVNADLDKIAKGIGNTATDNVNGEGFGAIIGEKPMPKFPDEPKFPGEPKFPDEPLRPWHPKFPSEEKPFDPMLFKYHKEYEMMDKVGH